MAQTKKLLPFFSFLLPSSSSKPLFIHRYIHNVQQQQQFSSNNNNNMSWMTKAKKKKFFSSEPSSFKTQLTPLLHLSSRLFFFVCIHIHILRPSILQPPHDVGSKKKIRNLFLSFFLMISCCSEVFFFSSYRLSYSPLMLLSFYSFLVVM